MLVTRVRPRNDNGQTSWLGFQRLTVVPIQTKMVKENMLTRDEIAWIKVRCLLTSSPSSRTDLNTDFISIFLQEHNKRCRDLLEPLIMNDKRAVKWLRREAERGIGMAPAGPGGFSIDWD